MVFEPDYLDYLRRAAEVEDLADRTEVQPDKDLLLEIAAGWFAMAERAAKRVGVELGRRD